MAALFRHRKVNMLELFFDLVFVNAISNLTSVIWHLDNGIINPIDYIHYLVSFFVFITIWITETLYLNRYGAHKYRDSFFLLVNMFLLLYLSNSAHRDWRMVFIPYSGKGGTLAKVPADAEKMLKDYAKDSSVASWAVRFAASQENVFIVLSGMSDYNQLLDNTSYMKNFVQLNDEELSILDKVKTIINSSIAIPCKGCQYCVQGCPKNI